ncbi:malonyl-ACP O-methyltransferase BioC [Testudinibacter sp. P80/BLE/0925]|uniref:malonyl-ACP O-methyltransferase BioC n=1 Tax=Testudinibacter sp. TW-1 TaxID=3417757 RepID=UPI003D36CBF6
MLAVLDKKRIGNCFAKALTSYDQQALAQQQINRRLADLLRRSGQRQFQSALEIGCGSGDLTRLLAQAYQVRSWCLNDLNSTALAQAKQRLATAEVQVLATDAERLDHTFALTQQFDLLVSASTVQWFQQPQRIIRLAQQALKPNGCLLFSTFLPQNLSEIKHLTAVGLHYPTAEQWQAWLEPHFELIAQQQDTIPLWFEQPSAVLRHLQATGVTATNRTFWTKGRLQTFCHAYQQQFSRADGKVSLTYAPLLILAKRR